MGEIEITAAGVCLTASGLDGHRQSHVGWYLSPLLGWLADNWHALLHEERYSWPSKTVGPAAIACRRALGWIAADDPNGEENWCNAQAWYGRHGIRFAATGGIFPDLFVRRFADDIELSWSGLPAEFSPPGLAFESAAGQLRLPVMAVAKPLWRTLCWAAEHIPPEHAEHAGFRSDVAALQGKIQLLRDSTAPPERTYFGAGLFDRVRESFEQIGRLDLFDHGSRPDDVPCIEEFSPAVAMFGGVEPTLDGADVTSMRDAMVDAFGGADGSDLASLVHERAEEPLGVPHQDGDRFATELLEDLGLLNAHQPVDVRHICERLEVRVDTTDFNTDSIRGIAFAGVGFAPRIVVNRTHPFNDNESGMRFTIAHELCHVLFDRTRARRVSHASGPWAPPGVEKRANAFAAYLLMPRGLVHSSIRTNRIDDHELRRLATALHVNESALIEHLHNLDIIDDADRVRLRHRVWESRRHPPAPV